jgi:hypothetical protein
MSSPMALGYEIFIDFLSSPCIFGSEFPFELRKDVMNVFVDGSGVGRLSML